MNQHNVELVATTNNPIDTVVKAIMTCRYGGSLSSLSEMVFAMTYEDKTKLIYKVIKMGHMSVIEHVSFTFGIEGISRACSHQIVRHRLAAISQESQRAVNIKSMEPIIPDSILKDEKALSLFDDIILYIKEVYGYLNEEGIPLEDARYLMPNATPTKMLFTVNARELHHIFDVRLCLRAEEEIRGVVEKMKELVLIECPELFPESLIGPSCKSLGMCFQRNAACPNFIDLIKRNKEETNEKLGLKPGICICKDKTKE